MAGDNRPERKLRMSDSEDLASKERRRRMRGELAWCTLRIATRRTLWKCRVYFEAGVHSTSLRRIALKPNHTTVKAVGVPIASGKTPPGLSLVCGLTVR